MGVDEAKRIDIGSGLVPEGDGWFVVNLRDAAWFRNDAFGTSALYQERDRSPQLGVNVGILEPGKPNCLYHAESAQEAFLVLSGECVLVVEGQERRLEAWDFFHCPPGTRHVFVGAGEGPCTILFIGSRSADDSVLYSVDETAAKYGASPTKTTPSPEEAYAGFAGYEPHRPDHSRLPWGD